MRLILSISLIVIVAGSMPAMSKSRYQIITNKDGSLSVKTSSKELNGKFQQKKGIFSRWQFGDNTGQTSEGFEIIVNDRTKKLLNISGIGGPFIAGASPLNKYVVLEEVYAPPSSPFEIRDAAGKKIFSDHHMADRDVIWVTEDYIIYPTSERNDKPTPAELKKCQETTGGGNIIIFWQSYDLKTKQKTKLNIPPEAGCAQ